MPTNNHASMLSRGIRTLADDNSSTTKGPISFGAEPSQLAHVSATASPLMLGEKRSRSEAMRRLIELGLKGKR